MKHNVADLIERIKLGEDRDDIYGAMQILWTMGEEAVAPLLGLMQDTAADYAARCRAANTLGAFKAENVVAALTQIMLEDEDVQVRWHALKSLEQIGDLKTLIPLRYVMQHDEGKFTIIPKLHINMKKDALEAIHAIKKKHHLT